MLHRVGTIHCVQVNVASRLPALAPGGADNITEYCGVYQTYFLTTEQDKLSQKGPELEITFSDSDGRSFGIPCIPPYFISQLLQQVVSRHLTVILIRQKCSNRMTQALWIFQLCQNVASIKPLQKLKRVLFVAWDIKHSKESYVGHLNDIWISPYRHLTWYYNIIEFVWGANLEMYYFAYEPKERSTPAKSPECPGQMVSFNLNSMRCRCNRGGFGWCTLEGLDFGSQQYFGVEELSSRLRQSGASEASWRPIPVRWHQACTIYRLVCQLYILRYCPTWWERHTVWHITYAHTCAGDDCGDKFPLRQRTSLQEYYVRTSIFIRQQLL